MLLYPIRVHQNQSQSTKIFLGGMPPPPSWHAYVLLEPGHSFWYSSRPVVVSSFLGDTTLTSYNWHSVVRTFELEVLLHNYTQHWKKKKTRLRIWLFKNPPYSYHTRESHKKRFKLADYGLLTSCTVHICDITIALLKYANIERSWTHRQVTDMKIKVV